MTAAKQHLRSLAWRTVPSLIAERDRRHRQAVIERLGHDRSASKWARENGARVASGPFVGLEYPPELIPRVDAAVLKLQGTYEHQLHPAIAAALASLRASGENVFVNVGCADGYYAVGMARASRRSTCAFEAAPRARRETQQLATLNHVDVEMHGCATERRLLRVAARAGALLCDVDGAELSLMTSRVAQALSSAVVIVELHGKRAILEVPRRFAASHAVEIIAGAPEHLRLTATPWLVAKPRDPYGRPVVGAGSHSMSSSA